MIKEKEFIKNLSKYVLDENLKFSRNLINYILRNGDDYEIINNNGKTLLMTIKKDNDNFYTTVSGKICTGMIPFEYLNLEKNNMYSCDCYLVTKYGIGIIDLDDDELDTLPEDELKINISIVVKNNIFKNSDKYKNSLLRYTVSIGRVKFDKNGNLDIDSNLQKYEDCIKELNDDVLEFRSARILDASGYNLAYVGIINRMIYKITKKYLPHNSLVDIETFKFSESDIL